MHIQYSICSVGIHSPYPCGKPAYQFILVGVVSIEISKKWEYIRGNGDVFPGLMVTRFRATGDWHVVTSPTTSHINRGHSKYS